MWRKPITILIALGLILGTAGAASAAPTPRAAGSTLAADSSCNPGRTPDFLTLRWVGWQQTATSGSIISAVAARLENLNPGVGWPGASSVWVMLADKDQTNVYVQAGFVAHNELGIPIREDFVEVGYGTGNFNRYILTPRSPTDALVDFQVIRMVNGYVRIYRNGILVLTVGPFAWLPDRSNVSAETHSANDQLFGGTWDYEDIDQIRYTVNYGNTYLSYGTSPYTVGLIHNSWPQEYGQFMYPSATPYAAMDLFDWNCH